MLKHLFILVALFDHIGIVSYRISESLFRVYRTFSLKFPARFVTAIANFCKLLKTHGYAGGQV